MAVLIEGTSVVIKDSSLKSKYFGGIEEFKKTIPNNTYCTDDELHRVGFMTPMDVENYVRLLESQGLVFLEKQKCIDFAVVDMLRGSTMSCDWFGFSRSKLFSDRTEFTHCEEDFSIGWLIPEIGAYGIPVDKNFKLNIVTPQGWNPDKALYSHNFVPKEKVKDKLIELETSERTVKYWYSKTGEFVYTGRPIIKNHTFKIDNGQKYSITWQEFGPDSQIAHRFWVQGKKGYLPFLIFGENLRLLENGESFELKENMLLFGILVGLNDSKMPFKTKENDEILISLLSTLLEGFKSRSLEQMILDAAFNLKDSVSYYCAYLCLKGGLNIEKDSSMIRSDLLMNIWELWKENPENGSNFMDEVIENFEKIDLEGVLPAAVEMIVYIAFVATYFNHPEKIKEFFEKYVTIHICKRVLKERIKFLFENKDSTLKDAFWESLDKSDQ